MKRYLPLIIIVGVLVVAFLGGSYLLTSLKKADDSTASSSGTTKSRPTNNGHSRGATGAVATIEEFGDYQCPPCGQLFPDIRKIEEEYNGKVRLIFRQYPLTSMHRNALAASQAAEAAGMQDHFWEMHDRLYLDQAAWSNDTNPRVIFTNYARDLRLDLDKFARDMDSQDVQMRIAADQRWGAQVGVSGTPTVFVNGRVLEFPKTNYQGIREQIELILKNKK
jgi:protein-disulfide isomerase